MVKRRRKAEEGNFRGVCVCLFVLCTYLIYIYYEYIYITFRKKIRRVSHDKDGLKSKVIYI